MMRYDKSLVLLHAKNRSLFLAAKSGLIHSFPLEAVPDWLRRRASNLILTIAVQTTLKCGIITQEITNSNNKDGERRHPLLEDLGEFKVFISTLVPFYCGTTNEGEASWSGCAFVAPLLCIRGVRLTCHSPSPLSIFSV